MLPFCISVPPFYFWGFGSSFLFFFFFWIIFISITLNYFSGRLPISSFIWSGGFFPSSFICCMFLCVFILFNLLWLGLFSTDCKAVAPLTESAPRVRLAHCLVTVSWSGGSGVYILMGGAGSCLCKRQCCVHWCVMGYLWALDDFGQGCVPVLIVVWDVVSGTVTWPLSGTLGLVLRWRALVH